MNDAFAFLWAKSPQDGGSTWHPLILHLLDVAASADAILAREPESTRKRMGEVLGLEWEEARPSILLLIACHDLGVFPARAGMNLLATPPAAEPPVPPHPIDNQ